jgi:hypothetical protein
LANSCSEQQQQQQQQQQVQNTAMKGVDAGLLLDLINGVVGELHVVLGKQLQQQQQWQQQQQQQQVSFSAAMRCDLCMLRTSLITQPASGHSNRVCLVGDVELCQHQTDACLCCKMAYTNEVEVLQTTKRASPRGWR